MSNATGNYTVVVDGQKYNVQIAAGNVDVQVVPHVATAAEARDELPVQEGAEVRAMLPGAVWKIIAEAGTAVNEGDKIMILESMKMEVDIVAPCNGVVQSILVRPNDKVVEGQALAIIG